LRGPMVPILALVCTAVGFAVWGAVARPDAPFLTLERLALVAKQSTTVGVCALGLCVVVGAGGLDLSVGALLTLCSVLLAKMLAHGVDAALALAGVLAFGAACGTAIGTLIARARLVPLLATLGALLIYRGSAMTISSSNRVTGPLPDWMQVAFEPPRGAHLFTAGTWLMLALALVLVVFLRWSVRGRHVLAVGSNPEAARLCGLPVARIQVATYAFSGACAALAGCFALVDLGGSADPTAFEGLELQAVAAVILGGASLSGGRTSVLGALAGAALVKLIASGCVYAGLPSHAENMLVGLILLVAILIDRKA
jgi:ribose transport system permease protein